MQVEFQRQLSLAQMQSQLSQLQMPNEDSHASNGKLSKKRPGTYTKMAPMPNTIQNQSDMGEGTFDMTGMN